MTWSLLFLSVFSVLFYPIFQVASVAYDHLAENGVLARLYRTDRFIDFLQRVLDLPALYRLDDPLGACSINLFKPGLFHELCAIPFRFVARCQRALARVHKTRNLSGTKVTPDWNTFHENIEEIELR